MGNKKYIDKNLVKRIDIPLFHHPTLDNSQVSKVPVCDDGNEMKYNILSKWNRPPDCTKLNIVQTYNIGK